MGDANGVRRPLLPRCERVNRRRWALASLLVVVAVAALATISVSRRFGGVNGLRASAGAMVRHFATKTMYWDQRRRSAGRAPGLAADAHGFRLAQTQLVTRHGIRYPTLGPIKDLELLLEKLRPMEAHLPRWLHGYRLQYNQSVEGQLAASGTQEMAQFAERQLADHGRREAKALYTNATYQISHTHVARTRDSAVAFTRAYFENAHDVHYVERPKLNDTLLRFFDVCERYQRQVKQNASALAQAHAFARSNAMKTSLDQLAAALNVEERGVAITPQDLAAAFSACAFDVALYDIHDQWCSLFTVEMVQTLDFDDDLKAFYQLAGGFPINYEMAAVLLQDVVSAMDARASGASSLAGVFRFAHAETTLPLMTLLGYGDKTPLLASASRGSFTRRGFRTSVLAPFAANIEFRVYEGPAKALLVQVLVNERDDLAVPGCDGRVLCPLETLKDSVWRRFLYEYDFERQCLSA